MDCPGVFGKIHEAVKLFAEGLNLQQTKQSYLNSYFKSRASKNLLAIYCLTLPKFNMLHLKTAPKGIGDEAKLEAHHFSVVTHSFTLGELYLGVEAPAGRFPLI